MPPLGVIQVLSKNGIESSAAGCPRNDNGKDRDVPTEAGRAEEDGAGRITHKTIHKHL